MLENALTFSHSLLKNTINRGDLVIDATAGNGHDTLFLAKLVGPEGRVLAFDIQQQAIDNTQALLSEHNIFNTSVIHDGHQHLNKYLSENTLINGAIFNLGYLPGADKKIITNKDSTLAAIKTILPKLANHGLVVLVVYYGHPGGQTELSALLDSVTQLPQQKYAVLQYQFINQVNQPPLVLAIQKK